MIEELRKALKVLEMLDIKPNYAELARRYHCDRRTVKKYSEGYEGKSKVRNRKSCLDKYRNGISEKINLPGATIMGTYKYFLNLDKEIGGYQNFNSYVKKHNLKTKESSSVPHPRYETEFGEQLQFDWKEDIKMYNKQGELFEFNIFSAILSASRLHIFTYSKTKLREDVQRCLIDTFKYIQGIPKELLTDNMSSIVNTSTKQFVPEFTQFCKDMNTKPKRCKVKSPETKGKVESSNRFMSWLIPYNYEFETEQELIDIIKKITKDVNQKVNETTGVAPIMLYNKEKEYLLDLPNKDILDSYSNDTKVVQVSSDFLVYFRGHRYSVPPKFINKRVQLKQIDNKLYIYYNKELIIIHELSNKKINYDESHYIEGLQIVAQTNKEEVEKMAKENLALLGRLTV